MGINLDALTFSKSNARKPNVCFCSNKLRPPPHWPPKRTPVIFGIRSPYRGRILRRGRRRRHQRLVLQKRFQFFLVNTVACINECFSLCVALANSRSEASVPSKAWNEPSRTPSNASATKQPQSSNTANSNLSKSLASGINVGSQQQQKLSSSANANAAKTKPKKEEVKKTAATPPIVVTKNDELSKWGIKALSGLKPAVDGGYFRRECVIGGHCFFS